MVTVHVEMAVDRVLRWLVEPPSFFEYVKTSPRKWCAHAETVVIIVCVFRDRHLCGRVDGHNWASIDINGGSENKNHTTLMI